MFAVPLTCLDALLTRMDDTRGPCNALENWERKGGTYQRTFYFYGRPAAAIVGSFAICLRLDGIAQCLEQQELGDDFLQPLAVEHRGLWRTLATSPELLESVWTTLKRAMHPEATGRERMSRGFDSSGFWRGRELADSGRIFDARVTP